MTKPATLRLAFFGKYGVCHEQTLTGPRALSAFMRAHPGATLAPRYSANGTRMTRRGAIEVHTTAATVTLTALRGRQPAAAAPCDRCGTTPAADSATDSGAVLCAACETERRIAATDTTLGQNYRERMRAAGIPERHIPYPEPGAVLPPPAGLHRDADGFYHYDEIEPADAGAYCELAPMPTPRLRLEAQPVPLSQASLI